MRLIRTPLKERSYTMFHTILGAMRQTEMGGGNNTNANSVHKRGCLHSQSQVDAVWRTAMSYVVNVLTLNAWRRSLADRWDTRVCTSSLLHFHSTVRCVTGNVDRLLKFAHQKISTQMHDTLSNIAYSPETYCYSKLFKNWNMKHAVEISIWPSRYAWILLLALSISHLIRK